MEKSDHGQEWFGEDTKKNNIREIHKLEVNSLTDATHTVIENDMIRETQL